MAIAFVTYNIHSCLGVDQQWLPSRIANLIHGFRADVVALQEVGWHLRGRKFFDQFQYFAEHSGFHVTEGPVKQRVDAHFGNATLTRAPPLATRLIDLTMSNHTPRGAVEVDVDVRGERIRVVNLHLGLTPWERRVQIHRVIDELERDPDTPTVVMGDFNHWRPGSDSMDKLSRLLPLVVQSETWPTRMPIAPFDRICASPHFRLVDQKVIRTEETRQASDHYPLMARLALA